MGCDIDEAAGVGFLQGKSKKIFGKSIISVLISECARGENVKNIGTVWYFAARRITNCGGIV